MLLLYICYCRVENLHCGRKHWQIQLFELFGGENLGEWSPMDIGDSVNLREKTLVICHQFAKFAMCFLPPTLSTLPLYKVTVELVASYCTKLQWKVYKSPLKFQADCIYTSQDMVFLKAWFSHTFCIVMGNPCPPQYKCMGKP